MLKNTKVATPRVNFDTCDVLTLRHRMLIAEWQ